MTKSTICKVLRVVLVVICALATTVTLLTATFCVLLMPVPTRVFASMYVRDDISPMSHDYLVEIACQTLEYSNGNSNAHLPLGDNELEEFTPNVMSHLDDVAVFFGGIKVAAVASVVVFVASLALLRLLTVTLPLRNQKRDTSTRGKEIFAADKHTACKCFYRLVALSLRIGAILLAALTAIIALTAVIDFSSLFNLLHSFFFNSGSWLFSYRSLLICALPEAFWIAMAAFWGVLLVASIAITLIAAHMLSRKSRVSAISNLETSSVN